MRLAKYLAHAGVASRRAAESLIAQGRVTLDGEVVCDPARDAGQESVVVVDGQAPIRPEPREVHLVHKPLGVVSTARDPQGRPTVVELVGSNRRLYPIGRLDADTTGLILLTNDGALAHALTHPRYGVPRTYHARVHRAPLRERALRALRAGIELDDGPTAPARVRRLAPDRLELVVHEGRKRQVRRMCAAVGHPVAQLERVGFGSLRLDGLAPGEHRRLTDAELARLRESAAPTRSQRAPRSGAGRAGGPATDPSRPRPPRRGAQRSPRDRPASQSAPVPSGARRRVGG